MIHIPKGFRFATANAGFRKPPKLDTALVISDTPAAATGTFTVNQFPAAPVQIGKKLLSKHSMMRAILINSGQANACTGEKGLQDCYTTLELIAAATGLEPQSILPASTGVIGEQFNMSLWEKVIPVLASRLGKDTPEDFSKAIMTTDAFPKLVYQEIQLTKGTVRLTGIAKGAGMICPNMATMLAIILCDVTIETSLWQKLLTQAVSMTFNRVTVDGDTSTNDTVYGLANGCSGISVTELDNSIPILKSALTSTLSKLAYMLVQDGEGATKVACIHVTGAVSDTEAEHVARAIGNSQLVKTALFGQDPNWGRIVAAIGRSGANFNPQAVKISLCGIELFANGQPTTTNVDSLLKEPLKQQDIPINITLGDKNGTYTLLASDLSHNYIRCNADYRS